MNSRNAQYVGVAILAGSVVLAALQVPALVWLVAIAIAVMAIVAVVMTGREQGTIAETTPQGTEGPDVVTSTEVVEVADPPAIAVEAVRAAEGVTGAPAVWLHRSGGRRVHRFADGDGWTVQQVSTKDPDDPRKRIIGEPLTLTSEDEAIEAAGNLAQGILPRDVDAARQYGVPPVAMAEARRRKVQLKGREEARRLATEWGVSAGA